jgi:glyoxylase-like metal-dependent hydrolase (beta-lactamase superfamily II)
MKGLKFAILHHGYIENDLAWNVALPHPGSVEEKNPPAEWVRVPTFSVLVWHPKSGYLLYDSGSCPGDEKERRPAEARRLLPYYAEESDFLDAQLAKLGIGPKDLKTVIISHMHSDHSGGLKFLANTEAGDNVIVGKKDFEFGLVETHRSCKQLNLAYLRENFDFGGLSYNLIEEDMELVPGVDLIMLEGHAPSIVGLVLHLESGVFIFPSDAVYTAMNYGPPMRFPGFIYDTLGFERSIKKLYALQKALVAKVIFPHDPVQYAELKRAPYFYE